MPNFKYIYVIPIENDSFWFANRDIQGGIEKTVAN